MATLESLKHGSQVKGIHPSGPVTVLNVQWHGSDVVELTYRDLAGRAIIRRRVKEALGEEMVGQITPHSFRHYFVTIVLLATGGNLRIAQELARHSNVATTQRYTHLVSGELDEAYHETFNQPD